MNRLSLLHSFRRFFVLCFFSFLSGVLWAEAPVGTSTVDFLLKATASTKINEFWSRYPQYAAEDEPFMRWSLGLAQPGNWKLTAEFDFLQQYTGWKATNLPLPDSTSSRSFPVEFHGLRKGDLEYNFHPLEIAFGRNKVHWGPTTDSLIVANQIPFLDRVWIHLPMGDWSLDDMVASPETRSGTNTRYEITTYQVAHRVSWKHENVEIGFTEQVILDRNTYDPATGELVRKGSYTLTDFLPFFSLHEADNRPFNSMMMLDASLRWDNYTLAFEGGLDDFDAGIFGIPDDPVPTIPAAILELRWKDPELSWSASTGYTHYLWGNFYGPSFGKAVYQIFLDNGVEQLPLTSPYGPGALWGTFSLRFQRRNDGIETKTEVWGVLREVTFNTPYLSSTPDPTRDWYVRTHVFGFFNWTPFQVKFGPEVLLVNSDITFQWQVLVTSKLGSPS